MERIFDVPFIIGEIGINHNGDLEIAKKLITMAKSAGCDAVKFQKRTIDIVYTQSLLESQRESPWGTTQRDQKNGLEFKEPQYNEIDKFCNEIGIEWFASAWDIESLIFLKKYNNKYNKIASAMLTNSAFLEEVAKERKYTFISTGMSTFYDIDEALQIFHNQACPFTLMHAVSVYPCKNQDCNIKMIQTLKEKYKCSVGYSGHEIGILPSVVAAVMGAEVIERHITLNRAMYGSDQAASLEKRGLEYVVKYAKAIPNIIGTGEKQITVDEQIVASKLRYFTVSTKRITEPEISHHENTEQKNLITS